MGLVVVVVQNSSDPSHGNIVPESHEGLDFGMFEKRVLVRIEHCHPVDDQRRHPVLVPFIYLPLEHDELFDLFL